MESSCGGSVIGEGFLTAESPVRSQSSPVLEEKYFFVDIEQWVRHFCLSSEV